MKLLQDTRDIVREVEQKTHRPVLVQVDPSLGTLAHIAIARGNAPAHVLRVKSGAPGVDYLVAYQCGFVLRLYELPPNERYNFGGRDVGRASVRLSLVGPGGTLAGKGLSASAVNQVTDQIFDGLLTQLRSVPIGMRVDAWLQAEYPSLWEQQEASLNKQQRDNVQALSPQIRAMAPPSIYNGNAAMNAAYALFCDRMFQHSLFAVPYQAAGVAERGQTLLGLWDNTPMGPDSDRKLVDAWGEELGLSDWYGWQPMVPAAGTEAGAQ